MSDDLNVIIEGYGHIISAILCLEAWLKEVDIPDRNSPHWRRSKLDRDEVVAMKEAIKAFKEKTDALLAEYEWAFKEIC